MMIEQFRLTVFFAVLTALYAIETAASERPWETPRWKRLSVHGALSAFNTVLLRLTLAGPLVLWTRHVHDQGWGIAGLLGLHGVPEILTSLIVLDWVDYWWHRLNHKAPFLWRFHRTHHLDTHVDVTTSLRFHPGELMLSGAAKFLWVLAWGPSLWGFAIFETGITAFAQFHHSNFDFPDRLERIIRRFILTPRLHTSHHTVTIRSRDANYATIFSAWDRLFGTFEEPNPVESKALGLPESGPDYLSPLTILKAPIAI